MKRFATILLFIGILGGLLSGFLKVANTFSASVFVISELSFLIAVVILPFAMADRYEKMGRFSRVVYILFWTGVLLLTVGRIYKLLVVRDYFLWYGPRNMMLTGYVLFMAALLLTIGSWLVNMFRKKPRGKLATPQIMSHYGINSHDLDRYVGVYTNEKIPLDIVITQYEDTLIAQATNQAAFYLEIVDRNKFKYPGRDIAIEFYPEKDELILLQHGGYFPFKRRLDNN